MPNAEDTLGYLQEYVDTLCEVHFSDVDPPTLAYEDNSVIAEELIWYNEYASNEAETIFLYKDALTDPSQWEEIKDRLQYELIQYWIYKNGFKERIAQKLFEHPLFSEDREEYEPEDIDKFCMSLRLSWNEFYLFKSYQLGREIPATILEDPRFLTLYNRIVEGWNPVKQPDLYDEEDSKIDWFKSHKEMTGSTYEEE